MIFEKKNKQNISSRGNDEAWMVCKAGTSWIFNEERGRGQHAGHQICSLSPFSVPTIPVPLPYLALQSGDPVLLLGSEAPCFSQFLGAEAGWWEENCRCIFQSGSFLRITAASSLSGWKWTLNGTHFTSYLGIYLIFTELLVSLILHWQKSDCWDYSLFTTSLKEATWLAWGWPIY